MSRTLVIAEPGSTHEGQLDKMLALVDTAAAIDGNVFKNQWLSSPGRLCERRHAPEYRDAYRRIAYPAEWHAIVKEQCVAKGLRYACTVYLPEDVETVAPYVDYFKIASFEAQALDMHAAIAPYLNKTIISTGMLDAVSVAELPHAYALLHCVSSYVTPAHQANLGAIRWMRTYVARSKIGWSDHTTSVYSGMVAVGAGAEVIEFHLANYDCLTNNPDSDVARRPAAAAEYVRLIREAEILVGTGEKRAMPCETMMLRYRAGVE